MIATQKDRGVFKTLGGDHSLNSSRRKKQTTDLNILIQIPKGAGILQIGDTKKKDEREWAAFSASRGKKKKT